MGDSTCLNMEPTPIEGLVVESKVGLEYCELQLDFVAFGVDVPIAHDFGVGSPVV